MDAADFFSRYWYKTELVAFCRKNGLPADGTKAELQDYIRQYLTGTPLDQIRAARPPRRSGQHLPRCRITEDTPLVGSGFSFNDQAREFFAARLGVRTFRFTKQMAAIRRRAEAEHDTTVTVADLLACCRGRQAGAPDSPEERTYQWNAFVRDFHASTRSVDYTNRLRVAAILWRHVRDSAGPKHYSDSLLDEHAAEISSYLRH